MSHLAPLISDLALILICAGIMTLVFKKLKQPLVLGYIVAGFLASPHFEFTPSVTDTAHIQIWSDIGVIFLLFALGLEFSFKKLVKAGGSAVISACAIIVSMILIGIFVGWCFGWQRMDCIYLGGMLAMSSTTIIYKAFDDMGLRQQRFAGLVLSILILEDILAIVLMVMLSTMAVSQNIEGSEMMFSILKLVFFLVLWFVVGIYLIPLFLKKTRKMMSDETLLIVSLAFCFGMVVLAAQVGFSPAFGAFVMGSILAETIDSERIEKLVSPVKDLFGAIFFVSVGMMVDPSMIVKYWGPIVAIVSAILLGQTLFGSLGVLVSGQPLKVAMQCGFSLTQIGEFAFIIASLGVSLGVTSDYLYPIVVAVSVITTFLTPYMIRLSGPAYQAVDRILPVRLKNLLEHYTASASQPANHVSHWKSLVAAIVRTILIYTVLSIAVVVLAQHFLLPLLKVALGDFWGRVAGTTLTILLVAPFLRALIMKKNHSIEFKALWDDSRTNHAPLISLILFRFLIACAILVAIIKLDFEASVAWVVIIALVLVALIVLSRFLKKQSILMERVFMQNLRSKDVHREYMGAKQPEYAGTLLGQDLHLSDLVIVPDSLWSGKTLRELDLSKKYGVHVVAIIRGKHRVNIPGGDNRIYPGDTLQVIGTDEQLALFAAQADKVADGYEEDDFERHEIVLKQFALTGGSPFVGATIIECGVRNRYHCLVVGLENSLDGKLRAPNVQTPLQEGDVMWVVGERSNLKSLFDAGSAVMNAAATHPGPTGH